MAKSKVPAAYYVREWYDKSDIDYFGAFVKVYIPFNAWMNEHFKEEKTDRGMLERVKNDVNTFRQKIETLLLLEDSDGDEFRSLIAKLHSALERSTISNLGEKITFERVETGKNPNDTKIQNYYGVEYKVHYDSSPNNSKIEVTEKRSGRKLINMTLDKYPSEESIVVDPKIAALRQSQRDCLMGVYRMVNPTKIESLLYKGKKKKEGIQCGVYKMISDTHKLAAGIVEILYSLRNALFHGIIDPNQDANKVYEAAYQIMHTLVGALT